MKEKDYSNQEIVISEFADARVRSSLGFVAVTTVTDPHPAVILHIARWGFVGQIIIVTRPDSIGMSAIQFQRWPLRQVAWDVEVPEGVALADVISHFFATIKLTKDYGLRVAILADN